MSAAAANRLSYYSPQQQYTYSSLDPSGSRALHHYGAYDTPTTYQPDLKAAHRAHNETVPISICPAEILSQIFLLCLPENPLPRHLLYFGAVCTKWRRTAWASSELWATLQVSVEYSEYESMRSRRQYPVDLLREWMQRTGSLRPVTLSIQCVAITLLQHQRCPFVDQPKLVQFISEYASRWGRLKLRIPQSWLDRLNPFTFTQLESLDLEPFAIIPGDAGSNHGALHQWAAPLVREVSLKDTHIHPQSMPWSQMRSVSIVNARLDQFLAIYPSLQSTANLRVTLFWGSFVQRTPLDERYQVDLPNLQHLSMLAQEPAFPINILSGLFAPNLRSITLNLVHYVNMRSLDFLVGAVCSFFQKCKLRRLELVVDQMESNVSDDAIRSFYRKVKDNCMGHVELKVHRHRA